MNIITRLLKGLIGSRKFVVTVSGFIVTLLAKYKFNVDPETIQYLVGITIAYVVGQGIADNGKEAAKIAGTVGLATARIADPVQAVRNKLA